MTLALSPQARNDAQLGLVDGELDVLIVGGGVVGAGAALDAVTRGLKVGLIEAQDYASGTSSRSSKLIHGGLRYLEMLDFRLVHEALIERGLLLTKLAPHLVKPLKFLYPLQRHWERPYVGAGVALYDGMARTSGNGGGLPLHKHLTKRRALKEAPALKPSSLTGAVQYYDAQVDDARHTFTLIRTAADFGAHCVNRTEVIDFLHDDDRIVGVKAKDLETGNQYLVHAKVVINATGVWTDEVDTLARAQSDVNVRASKGIHFTVAKDKLDLQTALILRTEKSVLFVLPWGEHWIIGTTDTGWDEGKVYPSASAKDIEYLLDHVNAVITTPLSLDDIHGVYAGLRPLLKGAANSTTKLSREHLVHTVKPGLVVVAGGKYTTYRVMAKDAVDEAAKTLGGYVAPSSTHNHPLAGADGYEAMWNSRHGLATGWGVSVAHVERLLNRYGSLTRELGDLLMADSTLAKELPGTDRYLMVEALYAASHEGALHLDDILMRRTRLVFESSNRGTLAATAVAKLVAPVLGWDAARQGLEVEHYEQRIAADRESEQAGDDAEADAIQSAVVDIVPLGQ